MLPTWYCVSDICVFICYLCYVCSGLNMKNDIKNMVREINKQSKPILNNLNLKMLNSFLFSNFK